MGLILSETKLDDFGEFEGVGATANELEAVLDILLDDEVLAEELEDRVGDAEQVVLAEDEEHVPEHAGGLDAEGPGVDGEHPVKDEGLGVYHIGVEELLDVGAVLVHLLVEDGLEGVDLG